MKSITSLSTSLVIVGTLLIGLNLASSQASYSAYGAASSGSTVSFFIPIDENVFNPCTEETVHVVGKIHEVIHISDNNHGGGISILEINYQNVKGVGETTGDKYIFRSQNLIADTFQPTAANEFTQITHSFLIKQGFGGKALITVTTHVSINANGIPTAVVENIGVNGCR